MDFSCSSIPITRQQFERNFYACNDSSELHTYFPFLSQFFTAPVSIEQFQEVFYPLMDSFPKTTVDQERRFKQQIRQLFPFNSDKEKLAGLEEFRMLFSYFLQTTKPLTDIGRLREFLKSDLDSERKLAVLNRVELLKRCEEKVMDLGVQCAAELYKLKQGEDVILKKNFLNEVETIYEEAQISLPDTYDLSKNSLFEKVNKLGEDRIYQACPIFDSLDSFNQAKVLHVWLNAMIAQNKIYRQFDKENISSVFTELDNKASKIICIKTYRIRLFDINHSMVSKFPKSCFHFYHDDQKVFVSLIPEFLRKINNVQMQEILKNTKSDKKWETKTKQKFDIILSNNLQILDLENCFNRCNNQFNKTRLVVSAKEGISAIITPWLSGALDNQYSNKMMDLWRNTQSHQNSFFNFLEKKLITLFNEHPKDSNYFPFTRDLLCLNHEKQGPIQSDGTDWNQFYQPQVKKRKKKNLIKKVATKITEIKRAFISPEDLVFANYHHINPQLLIRVGAPSATEIKKTSGALPGTPCIYDFHDRVKRWHHVDWDNPLLDSSIFTEYHLETKDQKQLTTLLHALHPLFNFLLFDDNLAVISDKPNKERVHSFMVRVHYQDQVLRGSLDYTSNLVQNECFHRYLSLKEFSDPFRALLEKKEKEQTPYNINSQWIDRFQTQMTYNNLGSIQLKDKKRGLIIESFAITQEEKKLLNKK